METERHVEGDGQLLDRLLAGDEAAFAELVGSLHGSLLRLARTFVADHGAAEEVVQETWLGVIKGSPAFERRSSLKTWIFRILVNRARTRGARDARTVSFASLESDDDQSAILADRFSVDGRWTQPPSMWREQDPEDLLLRRETAAVLEAAIAGLPEGQRAVVILRDVDGLDTQEVCNVLAITETNQRVLLHRARTSLRRALEVHLERG